MWYKFAGRICFEISKFSFQEKPPFSKYIPKVHRQILYHKSSQKLLCVGMRDYVKWTGKQTNNYRLSKKIKAKASEHYSVPHFQELTHKLFWEGRQHKLHKHLEDLYLCVHSEIQGNLAVLLSFADRGGAWHTAKVLSLQYNTTEIPMTKFEEFLIINIV